MATSRPRVYTRIRPLNSNELSQDSSKAFYCERGHNDVLVFSKDKEQVKTRFDYVFDADTSQEDVFKRVGTEVVSTLMSGYNATIFAYGQTGSGKTWTMEGDKTSEQNRGLIPRLIRSILDKLHNGADITNASVQVSFVQIYQEKVQDLLQNRRNLEIHLDRTGEYVAVGAYWLSITDERQAMAVYADAMTQRATTATEMNLVSSRSHMMLMMKMQWDAPMLPGCRAQLNLIDLAGSEKLYQSGATGETMKEAIAINKSLSALGNVVSKLVDAAKHKDRRIHIPYKDSKLTHLLQSSLGGSNLVHFILALSASSLWKAESTATVEFGKRALQLVLKPVRNPIDYKKLEEMEAMIDNLRSHIDNLEKEKAMLNKNAFLTLKSLPQEGDVDRQRRPRRKARKELRSRTELNRIIANLPETLEDLTSHCVLFPSSKVDFRQLGGLEKLVHFVDKSPSTFYRAHAAHTVAHVIDDEGRTQFGDVGGVEALIRLLLIKEERCKEAACVALEAAVRAHPPNKARLTTECYRALAELIYGYPNQQVTEAACTALAAIVDLYPDAKAALRPFDVLRKLLNTIRDSPEEVVHVTKAATTCVGRLAHGDAAMQDEIRGLGGISLLIDNVLFSPVGERDHQVPILASYALVNLCCSNQANMDIVRKHPEYTEVRCKLMEGLARAFGNNTVREGFGRATAEENSGPFPYRGVTVQDKWTLPTCGGRPIFSTFMENPQFYLYIHEDTQLSLMIQDVLYEQRMQQKQRNNTVYMGLAIFQGDAELCKVGLKQLDFHGKMTEIAKFTSNCENVLHCVLRKSETPYIVVPFTSQRGRCTTFALSAFADRPLELMQVPEGTGWARQVIHGSWNKLTGRGGESADWRNNPQISVTVREACRAVFILSYLSLDEQRSARRDDNAEDERANLRPRLHGRLFTNNVTPSRRYLKAFVPLPQASTFVAGNSFSSNSYITTTAMLQPDQTYTFIPFTDVPFEDSWRLCVYTDTDDVDVAPVATLEQEWTEKSFTGVWREEPVRFATRTHGRVCVVSQSANVYMRIRAFTPDQALIASIPSYWHFEAVLEFEIPEGTPLPVAIVVEGVMKADGQQVPARDLPFEVRVFADDTHVECTQMGVTHVIPAKNTLINSSRPAAEMQYPTVIEDVEDTLAQGGAEPERLSDGGSSDDDTEDVPSRGDDPQHAQQVQQLQTMLDEQRDVNRQLQEQLRDKDGIIGTLQREVANARALAMAPGSGSYREPTTPTGLGLQQTRSHSSITREAAAPPSRSGSTNARLNSRQSSRQQPNRPPIMPANVVLDTRAVAQDAGKRISSLTASDRPPTAAEWTRLRKELRDIQQTLA
jgi:cell division protein FtsB